MEHEPLLPILPWRSQCLTASNTIHMLPNLHLQLKSLPDLQIHITSCLLNMSTYMSKSSFILTSQESPLIFPQTHCSAVIHILINTTPSITLLKPKILQYSCLFFLSQPMPNPSAKPMTLPSKYFQNLTTSYQLLVTSCPPSIIAGASDLVSVLPFLRYFGLFSIRQPEEPLKQVRSCHTSVNPPVVPHLTHRKT